MDLTRRQFFKASTAAGMAVGWGAFGFDFEPAHAEMTQLKISRATEVRSICPYCAVGCSMIAYTLGDKSLNVAPTPVHIEGDPDSPINGGTLCPKGASTMQLAVNSSRVMRPRYRASGSTEWRDIDWDEALDRVARLMKESRDRRFVTVDSQGNEVNRNEGLAFVGGATFTNEEGYLATKVFRGLGCVYLEQQARV